MYPYIHILGFQIESIALAIILMIILFFYLSIRDFELQKLSSDKLIYHGVRLILPAYILGRYTELIIQNKSRIQPISHISSLWSGYEIYYIGAIIGLIIGVYMYIKICGYTGTTIDRVLTILAYNFIKIMIFSGILLLLGDDFIGRVNDGLFSIGALGDSKIQVYGKVYPIGLILSIVSLGSLISGYIWQYFAPKSKEDYIWIWLWGSWLMAMTVVFHYQMYTRYMPSNVLGIYMDIKSYFTLFLGIIFISNYIYLYFQKTGISYKTPINISR